MAWVQKQGERIVEKGTDKYYVLFMLRTHVFMPLMFNSYQSHGHNLSQLVPDPLRAHVPTRTLRNVFFWERGSREILETTSFSSFCSHPSTMAETAAAKGARCSENRGQGTQHTVSFGRAAPHPSDSKQERKCPGQASSREEMHHWLC